MATPMAISQEEYYRIRPTAAATPTLHGLPKFRIENVPMSSILSCIGSYNRECAAWLSEIFAPLRHHQATVKDSFEFLRCISNLSASDKITASLDVKSLFANVPVNFTIDLGPHDRNFLARINNENFLRCANERNTR